MLDKESALDSDSHANMAVVGKHCHKLECTGRTVSVYGHNKSLGAISRDVISGVFAYDDPMLGNVSLLIVNKNSLIPPAQMRCNDIVVPECPKSMIDNPSDLDHTIQILVNDNEGMYTIPLLLRNVTSYIPVRKPSHQEMANPELPRHELTYSTPE